MPRLLAAKGMLADVCADSGLVPPARFRGRKERSARCLPPYAPIANPSTRGALWHLRGGCSASPASSPPRRMWKYRLADILGNMAPEQVEQFSDVARAAVAACAPPPASWSSSSPISPAASIRPAAISRRASATSLWCRAAACRHPALDRLARRKWHLPTPEGSPTPSISLELLRTDASHGRIALRAFRPLPGHLRSAIDEEVVSLDEGMAAAGRIGYPVALKASLPTSRTRPRLGLVTSTSAPARNSAAAWRELEGILPCTTADARRARGRSCKAWWSAAANPATVKTIVGGTVTAGSDRRSRVAGGAFVELPARRSPLEPAPCFTRRRRLALSDR